MNYMGDPPDRHKTNSPALQWDKNKKLNIPNNNDPIYVTITRTNSQDTLENISPFLLKKAIDSTCGEVAECKKIRSGQVLVKCKNPIQANKLSTLIAITNEYTIDIQLHSASNTSKGVIYSNELRNIPETEILQELKNQQVIEVYKIQKKHDETLKQTGLIILTFQTTNLPTKINIGYSKVEVRPYIPPPMRCSNCLKYNFTKKFCKNPSICFNCGIHHTDNDTDPCFKPKHCSNCYLANILPTNHSATEKICPIFIKEKELQTIKITYKIDNKAAKQVYEEQHQHGTTSYATIAKQQNLTTKTIQGTTSSTHKQTASTSSRSITTYDDTTFLQTSPQTSSQSKLLQNKKIILPLNTPKRLRTQLKKATAKQTTTNKNNSTSHDISEISDSDTMDYTTQDYFNLNNLI